MSPPERPRYRLSSVTGYAADESGHNASERRSYTHWSVLDSWCLYQQVYEARPGVAGERSTRRICAWLEADDLGLIPTPHGSPSSYNNLGCRCDYCTAAQVFKKYRARLRAMIAA